VAKVRVGDIDIYYEEHGDAAGEAVLLIMGFGANAAAWAPQIPALVDAGYRVIAFDNRGAGRTTQPDGPYSIPQMADDAVGLLDTIGVTGAVHVIGASMGGMIAQEFVLRHPSRVRTLTLLCTSPGGPKSFGHAEMAEMSKQVDEVKDLSEMMTPERMQQGIDVMFTPEFMKAPDEGFQAMIMSSVMHPSTLAGVKGQMAAVLAHDTYDRLSEIRVPTLVMAGEDDTLVDARNSPLLAERIKGARLKMFAGLRHGFTAEQPEAVNAALIEFLADAKPAPAREGGIVERIKGLLGKREHARSRAAGG
jgi:pimeloyl-ACP methyl ester carboxylesterase